MINEENYNKIISKNLFCAGANKNSPRGFLPWGLLLKNVCAQ